MCIRLLSEKAIKLHELCIEGRQNAMFHGMFSRAPSQDYNHLLNVFANLQKIRMNVKTRQGSETLDFAGLGRLLAHAKTLQSLDLICTGARRQSSLVLSKVFKDTTWLHLKHFGLLGFTMNTNVELIAFFDRHRATIDSVALRSIFLHEETSKAGDGYTCEAWKHFFGELRKRSIVFQSLDLFEIHDCRNWEGEGPDLAVRADCGENLLKYLRDGGPNPLTCDSNS